MQAGSRPERRRIVTGDEQDTHTRWRRRYCYLQRAGATAGIKRRTRRRERHERDRQLRRDPDNA